jgi:hypothetical protein
MGPPLRREEESVFLCRRYVCCIIVSARVYPRCLRHCCVQDGCGPDSAFAFCPLGNGGFIRPPFLHNVEIKNAWSFTPFPQIAFMAWYLGRGTTLTLKSIIIWDMTPCSPLSFNPEDDTLHNQCCENLKSYCDVRALGNMACVDNRCYGNGSDQRFICCLTPACTQQSKELLFSLWSVPEATMGWCDRKCFFFCGPFPGYITRTISYRELVQS